MADTDQAAPGAQVADHMASAIMHDPLPEATWFWRRVFIFSITAVTIFGIWLMVQSIRNLAEHNPDLVVKAFVKVIGWLLVLLWSVITYYLVAPTGEQITRWVQTAGMLKSGVQLASSAVVRGVEGGSAQTSSTAGQGAVVPAPPALAPDVDVAPTSRK